MSDTTFTPQADDKFAEAIGYVELAHVKPSGYLNYRGIVPADGRFAEVVAFFDNYYAEQGRPAPVHYVRIPGQTEWVVWNAPTVEIPDTLEGFQA